VESVRKDFLDAARGLERYVLEDDMGGPHAGVTVAAFNVD
jgi:hypothetical protein